MSDPLKKDETIDGGATLDASGKWIDANGELLKGDALAAAKKRAADATAADMSAFRAENERRKSAGLPALPEPVKPAEPTKP